MPSLPQCFGFRAENVVALVLVFKTPRFAISDVRGVDMVCFNGDWLLLILEDVLIFERGIKWLFCYVKVIAVGYLAIGKRFYDINYPVLPRCGSLNRDVFKRGVRNSLGLKVPFEI